MNRILRNEDESIDEIVVSEGILHIEQMSDSEWSVGLYLDDGGYWHGSFVATKGLSFIDRGGDYEWPQDATHGAASRTNGDMT